MYERTVTLACPRFMSFFTVSNRVNLFNSLISRRDQRVFTQPVLHRDPPLESPFSPPPQLALIESTSDVADKRRFKHNVNTWLERRHREEKQLPLLRQQREVLATFDPEKRNKSL